ncbi:MAG TPA: acyl-CoA dehydrogenase family protein [Actinomycetota bacterium]
MDFTLSEDQQALQTSVREVVAEKFPPERVAEIADRGGFDAAAWKEVADLGWTGVAVPEASGGLGMGFVAEAVVAEELGRGLYPGPYLPSVTALSALGEAAELTERILTGRSAGTFALGRTDGEPDLVAERHPDGWRISGEAMFVPDLDSAEVVVVAAEAPDEPGLYAVERDAGSWESLPTVDTTRRMGRLALDGAVASQLATGEEAVEALTRRALAGLAAEAVGVAQRALEMGVQHAGEREQFGRPIGVYQAVSHRLADVFVAVEGARSLSLWAAWTVDNDSPDADAAVAAAKAEASEAAVVACEVAIQVHGGIGFTWEHPLHRFYKRALGTSALLGWPQEHRARIAAALLGS